MNQIFNIKTRVGLLTVFLVAVFFRSAAQLPETEILWDNFGVPHIYAKSTEAMYYAYGWSQMHSHANLILRLYGQARGKAAEYWGKEYLNSDKEIQLFKVPETGRKKASLQTAPFKSYFDAFVKGLNDYATAHPNEIGKEFRQVLPVTANDMHAHYTRIAFLEFLARADIDNSKQLITPGSNAIAIAPSKSASKSALLLANPHTLWSDLFSWYEAHLTAPGFDAYGASLVGSPTLNIAFNQHLGWTHTVNTIDASDRYELTLKDDGYVLDGKTIPFEKRYVTLKVREDDGTMREEKDTFLYSQQGPVIGEKNNKAYAVRIAGIDKPYGLVEYHKMAEAKTFAAFLSAVKMMQFGMMNIVYADGDGNIMYLFGGNVPVRTEGDWTFWSGTIDGSKSKYIWTKTHPYEDLPKLINPVTGFVQNANDPPWTCTYPVALDPKKFPAYMSPVYMGLRPQHAVKMVKDNPAISFDQLVAYKLNTEWEAGDRFLDDLLAAIEQYPDSLALKAATVLKAWDKSANADSKGAVLFEQWFYKIGNDLPKKPWSLAEPLTTPDGLSDPKRAVDLLVQTEKEVIQKYGSIDVAWAT